MRHAGPTVGAMALRSRERTAGRAATAAALLFLALFCFAVDGREEVVVVARTCREMKLHIESNNNAEGRPPPLTIMLEDGAMLDCREGVRVAVWCIARLPWIV